MPENLPKDVLALVRETEQLGSEIRSFIDKAITGSNLINAVRVASKRRHIYHLKSPLDAGGSGIGVLGQVAVHDTLGSLNLCHISGIFAPSPGVLEHAGEPIKSNYLKPLLEGEKTAAFAFTESAENKNPTVGRIVDQTLVINGEKSYVTGGARADFLNTRVDVVDHGQTIVVIDRMSEGVEVKKVFGSIDGSHHAVIRFHDVIVPNSHMITREKSGTSPAMKQISNTRVIFAAESVGLCRWVIDFVEKHLSTTTRAGDRLGDREGVRLRLADMRIRAFAARSMVYRTARIIDRGEQAINEIIAVKVFATETIGEIVDTAIQLCGGRALQDGHPLAELFRRVRALRLAEGANDVLRLNLAKGRLDLESGRI